MTRLGLIKGNHPIASGKLIRSVNKVWGLNGAVTNIRRAIKAIKNKDSVTAAVHMTGAFVNYKASMDPKPTSDERTDRNGRIGGRGRFGGR
jgi:hypothetical protein